MDYTDLYFQYTRSEGWSLDEGIVKSGSFAIEQGVGVRAVSGDRSAFAYSDEINAQALMSAADATRTIARSGRSGRTRVGDAQVAPARRRGRRKVPRLLYGMDDPIASMEAAGKVGLLILYLRASLGLLKTHSSHCWRALLLLKKQRKQRLWGRSTAGVCLRTGFEQVLRPGADAAQSRRRPLHWPGSARCRRGAGR